MDRPKTDWTCTFGRKCKLTYCKPKNKSTHPPTHSYFLRTHPPAYPFIFSGEPIHPRTHLCFVSTLVRISYCLSYFSFSSRVLFLFLLLSCLLNEPVPTLQRWMHLHYRNLHYPFRRRCIGCLEIVRWICAIHKYIGMFLNLRLMYRSLRGMSWFGRDLWGPTKAKTWANASAPFCCLVFYLPVAETVDGLDDLE